MLDTETMLIQLLHISTMIFEMEFTPELKRIFMKKLHIIKCMISHASHLVKLINETEYNCR